MPPPGPIHVGGSSAAAAAGQAGPSDVPIVSPPPLPQDILLPGLSFHRYTVLEIPSPADALSFLGSHADDEVSSSLFLLSSFMFCIFTVYNCSYSSVFQFVRIRVGDMRFLYSRGLYNWNLL